MVELCYIPSQFSSDHRRLAVPDRIYRLSTWDEQDRNYIELSASEFEEIKSAKSNLIEAMFIEEKMNILVEGYLEWETELLAVGARYMVQQDFSYLSIVSQRDLLARRMITVLTTCKGYLDHTPHHIFNIYGKDSPTADEFEKAKSEQYDGRFAYRAMEQLRNYVQHRGWPFHIISREGKRVESEYGVRLRFSTGTLLQVSELIKDTGFNWKKTVLHELEEKGKNLELQPLVREYIAGLSIVNQRLRDKMKTDVRKWEKIISTAIDRIHQTFPEQAVGTIFAFGMNEEIWLSRDYIDARRALEEKNMAVPHLHTHFVTNEIIPK